MFFISGVLFSITMCRAVGSVWMFIGVLGLGVLITILGQVGLSRWSKIPEKTTTVESLVSNVEKSFEGLDGTRKALEALKTLAKKQEEESLNLRKENERLKEQVQILEEFSTLALKIKTSGKKL